MAFTALGKKLSLSLVVLEFMNLYRFMDGSGTNSSNSGWGQQQYDWPSFAVC